MKEFARIPSQIGWPPGLSFVTAAEHAAALTEGTQVMKFVVIGGTGLIGSKVVARLAAEGHTAVAASPQTGVDTISGAGLAAALTGADVVVDVTNSPSFAPDAVMAFFTTSTR